MAIIIIIITLLTHKKSPFLLKKRMMRAQLEEAILARTLLQARFGATFEHPSEKMARRKRFHVRLTLFMFCIQVLTLANYCTKVKYCLVTCALHETKQTFPRACLTFL
jgi:hypothetical protein